MGFFDNVFKKNENICFSCKKEILPKEILRKPDVRTDSPSEFYCKVMEQGRKLGRECPKCHLKLCDGCYMVIFSSYCPKQDLHIQEKCPKCGSKWF